MANMLQDGIAWLADQLAAHAAEEVEYLRGEEVLAVTAVVADVEIELIDGSGIAVLARATDFLVRCADLVLAGDLAEPRAGDRIRRRVGVRTVTYEAAPLGDKPAGERDAYHIQWRIHTKQVRVE